MNLRALSLCLAGCLLFFAGANAQEAVGPLRRGPIAGGRPAAAPVAAQKTTVLSLPFFEDFTGYSLYPDPARWADSNVYVNNTMAVNPVSRGVATFDALNRRGRPYDTILPYAVRYGDSLTTQPIDLSAFSPADSVYLSFFFQPTGNGFPPEFGDSLILFFRNSLSPQWTQVWSAGGTNSLQPFRQVMIPVRDAAYFNADFRFRFVTKASIGTNDDIWNLDYIRMDAGRSFSDTALRDVAFTANPTPILRDFTAMPYRQFLANAAGERATQHGTAIRNGYPSAQNIPAGFTAVVEGAGTALGAGTAAASLPAFGTQPVSFPVYGTVPAGSGELVFENKYYLTSPAADDSKENDTIVHRQVFSNYLAYDDGTAEKSYFLNLFPTLPGKLALEFRLNAPDTLRGLAIYFGQQVPTASYKNFSIAVYSALAGVNGGTADVELHLEDFLLPQYSDTINDFTVYKFSAPVLLPAGIFYVGTNQPALSGSDSLYFALDVNRNGGNHLYYNVLNTWESSSVAGAIMFRPLLGGAISGVGVRDAPAPAVRPASGITVYPNPAGDWLYVRSRSGRGGISRLPYRITDALGRQAAAGFTTAGEGAVDVRQLAPGTYFLQVRGESGWSAGERFVK